MTVLGILWFFIVFLLIAGYFVLDGFDLGAGALSPIVARCEDDKAILRRSIGPVWDGNEVWLLTAGGALFAAFAPAYATTFSGFYLAIMLVLFGLILRAAALELRQHDRKWAKLWDALFFIGSLLPALLFGVAVGNVYAGIPLDANGDYAGIPLLGLVTPFTLLCGLLGLAVFLSQGATWLALKSPEGSEIQKASAKLRSPIAIVSLVLFLVVSVYALTVIDPQMDPALGIMRWVFALLFGIAVLATSGAAIKGCDIGSFISSSVSAVALVGLLATSMFPNLVVNTMGENITIANAASTDTSLMAMTIIACIGVPLVLVYHVIAYRVFRGRVTEQEAKTY